MAPVCLWTLTPAFLILCRHGWSPQVTTRRQDHGLSNRQETLGVRVSPQHNPAPAGGWGWGAPHAGAWLALFPPWLGPSSFPSMAIAQSPFSPAGLLQLRGAQEVWLTPLRKQTAPGLQPADATGHRGWILFWGA